jgi:hypothetical protein
LPILPNYGYVCNGDSCIILDPNLVITSVSVKAYALEANCKVSIEKVYSRGGYSEKFTQYGYLPKKQEYTNTFNFDVSVNPNSFATEKVIVSASSNCYEDVLLSDVTILGKPYYSTKVIPYPRIIPADSSNYTELLLNKSLSFQGLLLYAKLTTPGSVGTVNLQLVYSDGSTSIPQWAKFVESTNYNSSYLFESNDYIWKDVVKLRFMSDREILITDGYLKGVYANTLAPPALCISQCKIGSTQCSGLNYQSCFDVDNDWCSTWSTPVACPKTYCDSSKHLTGSCSSSCSNNSCSQCTPTCACSSGYYNCDSSMENGCESTATCITGNACGSAAKQYSASETFPNGNYCLKNNPNPVYPNNPLFGNSSTWTCTNDIGVSYNCVATRLAQASIGVCGSSSGSTLSSAPTSGLCSSSGGNSSLSGSGPWSWTCYGTNGGASSPTCTAYKTVAAVNGVCGSSSGSNFSSAPTINLCSSGNASVVSGSGPWSWTCSGLNGGTSSVCTANKYVSLFSCTGTPDGNSIVFDNDNVGLSANTPITLSIVNTSAKCEYYCKSGFVLNDAKTKCVLNPFVCLGTSLIDSNAVMYPNDELDLISNTLSKLVSSDSINKCEYHCKDGYYKGSGADENTCLKTVYSCEGEIDPNAELFIGDDIVLSMFDNLQNVLSFENTSLKCEWHCKDGYYLADSSGGFFCTGVVDSNSVIFSGDSLGLDSNLSKVLVDVNTSRKCEYHCASGYDLVGGACVLKNVVSAVCGNAERGFGPDELFFGSFSLCSIGVPSVASPVLSNAVGSIVNWICISDINTECSATRVSSKYVSPDENIPAPSNSILKLASKINESGDIEVTLKCTKTASVEVSVEGYDSKDSYSVDKTKLDCATQEITYTLKFEKVPEVEKVFVLTASMDNKEDCLTCDLDYFMEYPSEEEQLDSDNILIIFILGAIIFCGIIGAIWFMMKSNKPPESYD